MQPSELALASVPSRPAGLKGRLFSLFARNHGTVRGYVRLMLAQLQFVAGRLDAYCRPPENVSRLVFVCLGNINRSAFAEIVASGRGIATYSIGLSTTHGIPATPQAVSTAKRFTLSLDAHQATDCARYTYQPGDLLLAMEVRHVHELIGRGFPADAIRLLGYWGSPRRLHIHDPHTLSDEYFSTCFHVIHSAVVALCAEIEGRSST